ncbi:MAG TPA: RHS repeat-associated core domain-containing protein [Chthoniobacterales bacterium]|nr:RHS repeat-associated core domain-containing protein [Chthoniobacterales bacterium]
MKRHFQLLVLALSLGFLFPQPSRGTEPPPGTGNDNPTGVTGEYNGSITTAGSYDPYTGNAKRFVTDLAVTGSLGAYPLKWTRVLNTRGVAGVGFGHAGTWKHSYNWGLWVRNYRYYEYFPDQYEGPDGALTYPDGRSKQLNVEPDGWFYWYNENVEPDDQLVAVGNGHFDLIMADGGRVEFRHDSNETPSALVYSLTARKIVDPHGLETTLERDSSNRLKKIIEPGGRYLEITYEQRSYEIYLNNEWHTITTDLISAVQAYARLNQLTETVTYTYADVNVGPGHHYHLTGVHYAHGPPAAYTYYPATAPPEHPNSFVPGRIRTCNDPRFAGAMSRIEYEYLTDAEIGGRAAVGQVKREKFPGTSTFVSEVVYPQFAPYTDHPAEYLRRENRPDGSTRTFQYSNNGDAELEHYTDFKGQPSVIGWPMEVVFGGYIKTLTDALNRTTSVVKDNVTGAVLKITYHDQKYVVFDYDDPNDLVPNDAHYLFSKTDERGKVTSYARYPATGPNKRRVQQINYPDGGSETFTYNNFGQVLTHGLTSGGTEEFRYDERGLKTLSWPPTTSSDGNPGAHPTQYFYYQNGPHTDRLQYVVDPRGNTTSYEYNGRGQVTKVTHPDLTFTESQYKPDGALEWSRDELGHQTTYEYDEYRRVTKVTNHLHQSVTNSYAPWNGHGALSHTTSSVYRTTTQLGKMVDHDYDENFRRKWTKQAPGTGVEATTEFTYDPVGNLQTAKDPRGKITTYGYDLRNRQTSVRNNELGQTSFVAYDPAGNKERETRADGVFRTWKYDDLNRVQQAHDWRTNETPRPNQTTTYVRDQAGNATSITDAKGAVYSYVYDDLNRKESVTYPADASGQARTETWHYDYAGNLDFYKNTAGQKKNIAYDNRNRARHSWWDGGTSVGQEIVTDYDAAGRVEWIETRENGNMLTRVAYGYDAANRKIWEDQTLAGHPTRRVKTDLDADGRRQSLEIVAPPPEGGGSIGGLIFSPEMAGSGRYSIAYAYTERNQLKTISGNAEAGEDWQFNYVYDASGNMTTREALYNGLSSTIQCPSASYDALNRPLRWEQSGSEGFQALSHYRYDLAGREEATWRQEDDNRGESFQYDVTNQLKRVSYNGAVPPPSPTPTASPTPTPPGGTPTPSPTAPPSQQVAEPAFNPDGGTWFITQPRTVTLTTATTGASMRYTLNGQTPTATSGTLVSSGQTVSVVPTQEGRTLQAIAFKEGWADSAVHSATFYYEEGDGGGAPMLGQRVVTYHYTPDKLSRSSMSDTATGQTPSYTSSQLNQYTSVGGMGYTYDNNFNLTAGESFSGTYDAANRLVSASNSGMAASPEVELVYDGLGRCVKRTIQGVATIIIYDEWKPIAEWDGWTEDYFQAWNVYGPGADEILLRQGGKWGYVRYHPDANGNVTFLLDNDGTVVEKYTYDVFGRPKITDRYGNPRASSHYDNRFLFQGREYIGEVGVYDYRNRFYHPALGRFLQKDPTGFDAGDMNLFRYVADDPVNGSDPTGLDQDDSKPVSRPLISSGGGDWDWFNGRVGLDQMVQPQAGMNGGANSATFSYATSIDTSQVTYLGRTFNGGMKTTQTVTVDPCDCKITNAAKSVGLTNEYGPSGKIIGTGKASGASIKQSVQKKGSDCVLSMRGNEGNPLVFGGPGITYDAKVTLHSGKNAYDWKVKHDAYPSHRLLGPNGTAIHQYDPATSGASPWRLFPPTPSIHSSGTDSY